MELFTQGVVSGLTLGSLYAVVGLGFVIIYKTTRVLNFAHGQLLMLGAFLGLYLAVEVGLPYWPTFAVVVLVMGVVGVLVEAISYRPLVNASPSTVILATAAVGAIIQNTVRISQGQQLSYFPAVVSTTPFHVAGVSITPLQIVVFAAAMVLVVALWGLFEFTRVGLAMRAVSENRDAAGLVGINVGRISALVWALAGSLAGAAGLLIAPLILITPDMGVIANSAFVGAVLGGFSSIPASVAGGLILGVVETLTGLYFSTAYQDVVVFLILIVVLWFRPAGLFAAREFRRV